MTEIQAPNRLKAGRPRGFVDRAPADIAAAEAMIARIRKVYELYGFEPVETPLVEHTEALGKFLPDLDRPNEGVFSFKDDDEQWLSLRYDLTAPLARYVAEHYDALPKPYRSYRVGWVFRNEKPGPGRFRQFMQFDADTVGSASIAADAEMCMMAADCLEALGLNGRYVVRVNNRKVLDGILGELGLDGADAAKRRLVVLRAMDKLDRLGPEGVAALLGAGRKDESGDFTRGAELNDAQSESVLRFLGFERAAQGWASRPRASLDGLALGDVGEEGARELREMETLFAAAGYTGRIVIDPSIVRGLEYYTGPVFEAELTFEVKDEHGRSMRFGSVGGGGRYDGLVSRFRDEPVPATGFSIGISRLLDALRASHSDVVAASRKPGPTIVLVLDRDHLAAYQRLVAKLRSAGIAAEMYLGAAGMNAQLKYADKRGARCAVIQGSNERDAPGGPQIVVRDLALGAQLAKASKERADYLELRKKAQFAVPEAELVDHVKAVLARESAAI